MRSAHNAALRCSAVCIAIAVSAGACVGASSSPTGANPTSTVANPASTAANPTSKATTGAGTATTLDLRETYTFRLQAGADGACKWPVTSFAWPVSIRVTSATADEKVGSLVFPPTPGNSSNTWGIRASFTGTQLTPGKQSPGPAAAAYNVMVDGGNWDGAAPTRAPDGRGEIKSGTASGARLVLVLPGSDKRWECVSDATWSLLPRYVDRD